MIIAHIGWRDIACYNPSISVASLEFLELKRFAFDAFMELMKVRNEPSWCILFEMMKVGAAHSLSLICFNTPNLTSLSDSTFRVHSCIFGMGKDLL